MYTVVSSEKTTAWTTDTNTPITRNGTGTSKGMTPKNASTTAWSALMLPSKRIDSDTGRAMWLMMQQPTPDDYVIATHETHTVRELCELAFAHVGLDWQEHVVTDPRFVRPAEVDLLIGDPAKAKAQLGWEPTVSFRQLVEMMVNADLERLRRSR